MTRVVSDRRESGQNSLRSQRLAMPKSLLPVAVPPSFHTDDFPVEVDEASKRRVEGDGQACRPPQALALINDLTVAMPIRFSSPVELGVLRSPTRGPRDGLESQHHPDGLPNSSSEHQRPLPPHCRHYRR